MDTKKDEDRSPRLGCFHNGIILIVISFSNQYHKGSQNIYNPINAEKYNG